MKHIFLAMAAVSGLAVAAPVGAQPRNDDRSAPQSWQGDQQGTGQLQRRLEASIERGDISRRDVRPLRIQMNQLIQVERQYRRGGLDGWERAALRERSRMLTANISEAELSGNGRNKGGDRR